MLNALWEPWADLPEWPVSPATLLSLLNHALWNPIFWNKISTVRFTCNFLSYSGCTCKLKYWHCCMCIGNAASLVLSVEDYPPGDYNLTIEVVDVFGQIQFLSYSFFLPGEPAWHCVTIVVDILASLSLSFSLSHSPFPISPLIFTHSTLTYVHTEPFLSGQCFLDPRQLSVFCNTSLDNTLVLFRYICSYNFGPAEPCKYRY